MALFKYTALDPSGKKITGTIEADDKQMAAELIKREGNTPSEVKPAGLLDKDLNISFGQKKVDSRSLSVFCRQFVSITKAGVTIVQALEMLADQTENKTLKNAIIDVGNSVQKGETLANSMEKQGRNVFPEVMINMIRAGEASGNLEVAFDRVGIQFEKSTKLSGLVKKSLIYPIALIVIVVAVVCAMMILVIPTFSDMYASMDQELPVLTQMLVSCSDFMIAKWYVVILVVVAIVVFIKVFKSTTVGKYFFGKLGMVIPVFGQLTVKSAAANFARTLSTLTASGISMTFFSVF